MSAGSEFTQRHTKKNQKIMISIINSVTEITAEKPSNSKLKFNLWYFRYNGHVERTEVSAPTQNPIWNATLTFPNVKADELLKHHVEIELWDMVPHAEFVCLGFCTVDIQKALMDDCANWCRLEDRIDTNPTLTTTLSLDATSNMKNPHMRPVSLEVSKANDAWSKPIHGDMSHSHTRLHRGEHMRSSSSDDVDSIGDASSLLHPDHAWTSGSRRGSSQSEQLNVEQYQLGKDYSHSLPGSRRSSFQDSQGNCDNSDTNIFNSICLTGRRRSSCTRRDSDFSKSHKGSKTKLNRALSASSSEKRLTKTK